MSVIHLFQEPEEKEQLKPMMGLMMELLDKFLKMSESHAQDALKLLVDLVGMSAYLKSKFFFARVLFGSFSDFVAFMEISSFLSSLYFSLIFV